MEFVESRKKKLPGLIENGTKAQIQRPELPPDPVCSTTVLYMNYNRQEDPQEKWRLVSQTDNAEGA